MSDADTQAALREMSRSIGGLESTVKTMVTTWQSQEAVATQGRRDLHQKVDALRGELHDMGSTLAGAIRDIAAMKPSVEAFENAKAQALGAQKFGKWLWGIAALVSGAVGWILSNWITITPKH